MTVHDIWTFIQQIGWQQAAGGAVGLAAIVLAMLPSSKTHGRKRRWELPTFVLGLDSKLSAALSGEKYRGATYLGMANGLKAVAVPSLARESHMQIVGPTRSGKSQLLLAIAAQDLKRGMPVFFMEAKGDRRDFDQFLKASSLGARTQSVRYFNPQDPRSMTFNPIRPVPGQEPRSVAEQFTRAIGKEPGSTGQAKEYYDHLDYAKIQSMAEVFCRIGLEFTLRDAFYYFSDKGARVKAFDLCTDRKLVAMAEAGFKESEDTSGVTSMIRPWITGRLGELLNSYSPQIKLEEIFEKGQAAYFAIPAAHLQLLANPLGRMIITGLIDLSSWRQNAWPKPEPASVILDEFAQFATPSFRTFIETVGSARMWTILSHQTINQLMRVQGVEPSDFKSSIFDNTSGCKVVFRTPNPEDAEFWAAMLGTHRSYEDTEQVRKTFWCEARTGAVSRRWVEQFKIHPNRLKNLPNGAALVFSPGREDCLARTARLYPLLSDALPTLPSVQIEPVEGLDLESAAAQPKDQHEPPAAQVLA